MTITHGTVENQEGMHLFLGFNEDGTKQLVVNDNGEVELADLNEEQGEFFLKIDETKTPGVLKALKAAVSDIA